MISQGVNYLWDVDLAHVSNLSKENDEIRYLFIVMGVFSRHLWVEPLTNKQHGSIIEGPRICSHLVETQRSPFGPWQRMEKQMCESVGHYVTYNVTHANYSVCWEGNKDVKAGLDINKRDDIHLVPRPSQSLNDPSRHGGIYCALCMGQGFIKYLNNYCMH